MKIPASPSGSVGSGQGGWLPWLWMLLLCGLGLGAAAGSAGAATLSPTPFTVLKTFASDPLAAYTSARLFHGSDDFFYGCTDDGGGLNGRGEIFRVKEDGSQFSVVATSDMLNASRPFWVLHSSRDGKLYGFTFNALFRINPDGTGYSELRPFGASPAFFITDLIEGQDGLLYGLTFGRFIGQSSTIFRMARDGSGYTVLHTFFDSTEGTQPDSGLTQGPDGVLYGMTSNGGPFGSGTIFRVNPDGTGFRVLQAMSDSTGRWLTCRLLLATDGKLYGTAGNGGTTNLGTLFRVKTDGSAFEVLRNMGGPDGIIPNGGMTQASDGMIYGSSQDGRIYRIDPAVGGASYTVMYSLPVVYQNVEGELMLAKSGNFVGITNKTETGAGVVFSWSPRPWINSGDTATATAGLPFSYTVTASQAPGGFTLATSSLPPGLTVDPGTPTIKGVPLKAGTFTIDVNASTVAGTTAGHLSLVINRGVATVQINLPAAAYDGTPKVATVTTTPAGLPATVRYNGDANAPTEPGTYQVTAEVNTPDFTGTATAALMIARLAPAFTGQSGAVTMQSGDTHRFDLALTGTPPLVFQWQAKLPGSENFSSLGEGAPFQGVTSSALTLTQPSTALDGMQLRCVVTNAQGVAISDPFVVSIEPGTWLANLSLRTTVAAGAPVTVGYASNARFHSALVRAVGPGLAPFVGGGTVLAKNPRLSVYGSAGQFLNSNDDWGGGSALAAQFAATGAFPLPANSQDAAFATTITGSGSATMQVEGSGLGLLEIYDLHTTSAERLSNLSAIYQVGSGDAALVAGFVVAGTGNKTLLIRGVGPGLKPFGVSGALADPKLKVFDASGKTIASNDDWDSGLAASFSRTGAFSLPAGSKDAALTIMVGPGAYTVELSAAESGPGAGLIEIYELYP